MFEIYCDGSCKNNGKENAYGGWAFIIFENNEPIFWNSGRELNTTNQRMELRAAIESIEAVKNQKGFTVFSVCNIHTDSAYLHNCKNQNWYKNWEKNGWLNSKKRPVANKDLWEKLIPYFEYSNFNFFKVKAHSDNDFNNLVDIMAQKAAIGEKNEYSNN